MKPAERAVEHDGQRKELQPRVMQVLVALSKARPGVVSRDRLVDLCWDGRIVGDDSLNRCILALRHLAQEFTPAPYAIETVPRIGHRLIETGPASPLRDAEYPIRARRLAAAAILVIGIVACVAIVVRQWSPTLSGLTVAITSARDARMQGLAGDLASRVPTIMAGQSSSLKLVSDAETQVPNLILTVNPPADPAAVGARITLLTPDHDVLWSKELTQPSRKMADLKQQAGIATGYALRCASHAMLGATPLSEPNAKTYLEVCFAMADAVDDPRTAVETLENILADSPRFLRGWALLLEAESASIGRSVLSEPGPSVQSLRRHIATARKLDPHLAEAYLAEAYLLAESDFLGKGKLFDRAVAENPREAVARYARSAFLQSMGLTHDALVDAYAAVHADPLSLAARENYVAMLAIAGRTAEALNELKTTEQLWPGTRGVEALRGLFHLRWGDPNEALRIYASETSERATPRVLEPYLRARINPTPENISQALRHGRMVFDERPSSIMLYSQLLAEYGRHDELFDLLVNWQRMDIVTWVTDGLFRPVFKDFHREPRFMRVAKHLGLLKYWQTTGRWPDFCYQPDLPYHCKSEAKKVTTAA